MIAPTAAMSKSSAFRLTLASADWTPTSITKVRGRTRLPAAITEREVTVLLAEFATVWSELFPAEQARIVQLLVERVDVLEDALELRAEGLTSLIGELRQGERKAA
jgi:hypothetical protein